MRLQGFCLRVSVLKETVQDTHHHHQTYYACGAIVVMSICKCKRNRVFLKQSLLYSRPLFEWSPGGLIAFGFCQGSVVAVDRSDQVAESRHIPRLAATWAPQRRRDFVSVTQLRPFGQSNLNLNVIMSTFHAHVKWVYQHLH